MKFIVCLSLLVLMVYLVQAHPVLEEEESVLHSRQKRATCDLFSYGGKVNHSACAAHCLLKGFRGGYCSNKAVCNCRR